MGKMLTVKEVAERLNVSKDTVIRRIDSGEIKAVKLGREWRVDEEWLKRYIAGEPQEVSDDKNKERRERNEALRLDQEFEANKLGMTVDEFKQAQTQLVNAQANLIGVQSEVEERRIALEEEHEKVKGNLEIALQNCDARQKNIATLEKKTMEEIQKARELLPTYLERLAIIIFSQPVETADGEGYKDQTPAKREELIKYLEPVMKAAGITIALNDVGEYETQLHRTEKQRREAY